MSLCNYPWMDKCGIPVNRTGFHSNNGVDNPVCSADGRACDLTSGRSNADIDRIADPVRAIGSDELDSDADCAKDEGTSIACFRTAMCSIRRRQQQAVVRRRGAKPAARRKRGRLGPRLVRSGRQRRCCAVAGPRKGSRRQRQGDRCSGQHYCGCPLRRAGAAAPRPPPPSEGCRAAFATPYARRAPTPPIKRVARWAARATHAPALPVHRQ